MGFHSKAATLSVIESFYVGHYYQGGVNTTWADMTGGGGTIPANAKKVESMGGGEGAGIGGDTRLLYNGVEKVTGAFDEDEFYPCRWKGNGIGSEADLKWQIKLDSGPASVFISCVGWYATTA